MPQVLGFLALTTARRPSSGVLSRWKSRVRVPSPSPFAVGVAAGRRQAPLPATGRAVSIVEERSRSRIPPRKVDGGPSSGCARFHQFVPWCVATCLSCRRLAADRHGVLRESRPSGSSQRVGAHGARDSNAARAVRHDATAAPGVSGPWRLKRVRNHLIRTDLAVVRVGEIVQELEPLPIAGSRAYSVVPLALGGRSKRYVDTTWRRA